MQRRSSKRGFPSLAACALTALVGCASLATERADYVGLHSDRFT